jgi:hypothetical protein
MALLLLFEKSDNLSYKELQATTKMAEDQFPRYVQSLLEAKLLNCNTEVTVQNSCWLVVFVFHNFPFSPILMRGQYRG